MLVSRRFKGLGDKDLIRRGSIYTPNREERQKKKRRRGGGRDRRSGTNVLIPEPGGEKA